MPQGVPRGALRWDGLDHNARPAAGPPPGRPHIRNVEYHVRQLSNSKQNLCREKLKVHRDACKRLRHADKGGETRPASPLAADYPT